VSERTDYKWLERYRAAGFAGLENRPSRAHTVTNRTPEPWTEPIASLRRECRVTARAIAERLRLARSTVATVLKRLGLNRLGLLRAQAAGTPLRVGRARRAEPSRRQ
jgi:transposase